MREAVSLMPHNPSAGEFRTDLQILRAVAVIIVLLFHLHVPFFGGGFVGVDVFFVLSGYFVTHTLVERSASIGWPEILGFYNRRIRRILPLATVVLVTMMGIAPFLLTPPEIADLTKQSLVSAFGAPNVFFSHDNNYFVETLFRPLLHFWSLGVEYQYYALFPFLFLGAAKFKWFGIVVFAASFIFCAAMTVDSKEFAFFWIFTRVWEFMLGFYAFQYRDKTFFKRAPFTFFVPLLSIVVIFGCAMGYDAKMFFPGVTAAVPALATALLIYFGLPGGKGILLYPQKLLAWIGTLSFSIYLWHYPVLWAFTYKPFVYYPNPSGLQAVAIVFVTMVLSVASYRFIEAPMRSVRRISNRKFFLVMAALYLALIGMAGIYAAKGYSLRTFTKNQTAALSAVNDRLPYRCDKISRMVSRGFESCMIGDAGTDGGKNILLAGDSHADAIKAAFLNLLPGTGHNLFIMKENYNPGQEEFDAAYFLKEIERRKVGDFVFHGLITGQKTLDELEKIIESAEKTGVRVHIIDPTPVFDASVVMEVYYGRKSSMTRGAYEEHNKDYFAWKKRIQAKFPKGRFYSVKNALCPDMCVYEKDGHVLYFDAHHLTIFGANLMSPAVKSIYGF